jgi:site-specific DNA-methyltransferase (adenine-specific)
VSKSSGVNRLFFGDNLDVLREYISDESVDLIYLDPPFNSQAHYNLVFERPSAEDLSAQAGAFRDTWMWGDEAEWSFQELMRIGGGTARLIDALRSALKESDMMAYLAMMALRLHELRRKLKPTGSLYLHCDPTASHYLKILLDGIFGVRFYRNEIIWKRTSSHNDASQGLSRFGKTHDVVLFYSANKQPVWNLQFAPYSAGYLKQHYSNVDAASGRRFKTSDLTAAKPGGDVSYEWRGVRPPKGRYWAYSRANMQRFDDEGLLVYAKQSGMPRLKHFLDEMRGVPLGDVWDDISPINSQADERIGYPTQKPLALLDRIIKSSTNPGDIVLDPFCGCGTTIESAENNGRNWIGIDVAVHAIKVIEVRLAESSKGKAKYQIEGMPRDFPSALKLAERDKYQFQWWANYLFNPHALREQKKGADRGIDGELFFPNGPGRPWGRMLTSVKGGEQIGPSMVRDFARVLDREGAQLGLFICLYPPTREMKKEAASVGLAKVVHGDIPKLQIVAIEDWFKGKMPLLPPLEHLPSAAFSGRRRPSPKNKTIDPEQPELPFSFTGGKSDKSTVRHFNLGMVRAG